METPRTIALIPARAGSTRIRNKNLARVGERTLIGRSVDHALLLPISAIVVFTDIESVKLESDVRQFVVVRSPNGTNETALADRYLLEFCRSSVAMQFDRVLLLQPTSPFRDIQRIVQMLNAYQESDQVFASGYVFRDQLWEQRGSSWHPAFGFEPRRQQERPVRLVEDGNSYLFSISGFLKAGSLAAMKWKFYENTLPFTLDINDQDDLKLARFYHAHFGDSLN